MRLIAPLHSEGAKGLLLQGLVYASWKGRPYVRRYAKPHNPRSEKQQAHRALFKEASQAYRELTEDEKKTLNRRAQKLAISGFNLFVKRYMEERKEKH